MSGTLLMQIGMHNVRLSAARGGGGKGCERRRGCGGNKRIVVEMIIRRWRGRKWIGGGDRGKNKNGSDSTDSDIGRNGIDRMMRKEGSQDGKLGGDEGYDEPLEDEDWRRYRARLVASEGCFEGCYVPNNGDSEVWAHTVSAIEPGCLLLAKPKLEGWFTRTVVLVLDHDRQTGSLGVTLNRLTSLSLEDVGGVNMDSSLQHQLKMQRLYVGGPVASNTILSLSNQSVDGSVDIVDGVYCGGLKDACNKLQRGDLDPDDLRLYMGYCGWSPFQLEQEVEKGYWWIVSASNNILQNLGEKHSFDEERESERLTDADKMHDDSRGAYNSSLWSYLYHVLKFDTQGSN